MLTFEILVTLVTIIAVLVILYRDLYPPSGVIFGGVLVLIVLGVLRPKDALEGFSNVSVAIIILLTLIATAVMRNFRIEELLNKFFTDRLSAFAFYSRMIFSTALFSSVVNNTPIVAALTPYVYRWARNKGFPPSKFLMALSFATILGGVVTVIGTSTNLILIGMMRANDVPLFSYWTFSAIGAVIAISGMLFLVFPGFKMMPEKSDLIALVETNAEEYFIETTIQPDSSLIGKTVREAGLRNLKKVYLHEIRRNGTVIFPIDPDEVLQFNDELYFTGSKQAVVELARNVAGLTLNPQHLYFLNTRHRLLEIIITAGSSLINQTVRQSDFRSNYSAAILAIGRAGANIRENIGDHRFKVGDMLLLITDKTDEFFEEQPGDFLVISSLEDKLPSEDQRKRFRIFITGFAAGIIAIGLGYLDFFVFLLCTLLLLTGLGFYSFKDLRKDLNFDLVGMLVFSLALGQSLISSGAADALVSGIKPIFGLIGYKGVIAFLMIISVLATNMMSNAAAAALVFPIAFSLDTLTPGQQPGYYLSICYGASCCFASPLGYQTNLMVYGPGGYSFADFLRVGTPLTLIYSIVAYFAILWAS